MQTIIWFIISVKLCNFQQLTTYPIQHQNIFSKYISGLKFNVDHEYYIQFNEILLSILKFLGQTHTYYITLQKIHIFHLRTISPKLGSTKK